MKTLSLTISKAQTLVDFVGDSRLPFTQIIHIYRQRKLPQSLKSVPKMSLKKYKTKFRLNVSSTLTMTLFPTGTKRNLFFFYFLKQEFCKWLNEYELHKASFLRSFLRVTFSLHFISLDGSPVRLKSA